MSEKITVSKRAKINLWIAAAMLTGLSAAGLPLDCFPLIAIGIVGDTVFLILIGGPHGGGNRVVDTFAGIACVVANTIFFYYLFRFILKIWRARRPK